MIAKTAQNDLEQFFSILPLNQRYGQAWNESPGNPV
jgi:hypothetical protein